MVDSNIIISAGLFPKSDIGKALKHIMKEHVLLLCKYSLDELTDVFINKFPERTVYFNEFVSELKYELINLNITDYKKYPKIRDNDDVPILANAIESNADILISGDKDFDEVVIDKPKIMKPRNYIDEYMRM
jgi:putative PIN family toxin of toxin-antitoxin system